MFKYVKLVTNDYTTNSGTRKNTSPIPIIKKMITWRLFFFIEGAHLLNANRLVQTMIGDALPSHGVKPTGGFHKVKLRKLRLGGTLPTSNSRKG